MGIIFIDRKPKMSQNQSRVFLMSIPPNANVTFRELDALSVGTENFREILGSVKTVNLEGRGL